MQLKGMKIVEKAINHEKDQEKKCHNQLQPPQIPEQCSAICLLLRESKAWEILINAEDAELSHEAEALWREP